MGVEGDIVSEALALNEKTQNDNGRMCPPRSLPNLLVQMQKPVDVSLISRLRYHDVFINRRLRVDRIGCTLN